ncbi:MAG: DUF3332 family protein [Candidatus Omnitrophica bacterium]|nr:DUF3332 family protein [Candidatus Omnitrophota bacterium]
MHRALRTGIVLVALGLLTSGCFGPFNLTRRLYRWNEQVGAKWEREFMFLILAWLPIYGVAVLGDAVVFNSMEFWTGNNPVDPPTTAGVNHPATKRIVRGEAEAVLTYTPSAYEAPELLVEQFRDGQPAGSLRLSRRDGVTVGSDDTGRTLFVARTRADGGVDVQDADGKPVAF